MIDLSVLSVGNLVSSIAAGLIAGAYLAVFHPTMPGRRELVRRSLLQSWYFGFMGGILYIARIAFAFAGGQTDVSRLTAALLLWILFAVSLGAGVWLWSVWRERRSARRLKPIHDVPTHDQGGTP